LVHFSSAALLGAARFKLPFRTRTGGLLTGWGLWKEPEAKKRSTLPREVAADGINAMLFDACQQPPPKKK
jgi:hypothetical protein